jgi:hypothetical protein
MHGHEPGRRAMRSALDTGGNVCRFTVAQLPKSKRLLRRVSGPWWTPPGCPGVRAMKRKDKDLRGRGTRADLCVTEAPTQSG